MTERANLYATLGDFVVYRNLEPADERLRGLPEIWPEIGLSSCRIPRKLEPDYATTVVHFLGQAQALRLPNHPLKRLLYIGDTVMNDGTAIANLGQHKPILGVICTERPGEAKKVNVNQGVMTANRWGALRDFVPFVTEEGFPLDEEMAAIIDLDKTAMGARGRNDGAIDAARVEAVRRTMAEVLGSQFDMKGFRTIYDELNQPPYHPFTADNQDYLAYICLMVGGGVYDYETLLADLAAGRLSIFAQFVEICAEHLQDRISSELLPVHQEVYANFRRGDPTPFKSFRYREYEETVARMDSLPAETDPSKLLAEEIVITREVVDLARFLQERGVLLFGLSDKPDEASIPRAELVGEGYAPIHRTRMKVVGEAIYEELSALT
ncbi:MAG: hypothetical protein E3J21_17970 [Anaerolineales bacterium]|nr:MAG: hypothetical protein E3J21_17970 [Anaerolineales bacterium]